MSDGRGPELRSYIRNSGLVADAVISHNRAEKSSRFTRVRPCVVRGSWHNEDFCLAICRLRRGGI